MNRRATLTAVLLAGALAAAAFAVRDELAVGSPAPGLDVETWAKGDPVTMGPGAAYVVIFFTTKDGASARLISRLKKFQELFGRDRLVVAAISQEEPDTIQDYVRLQRDRLDCAVGVDRRSSTSRGWLGPSGLKDPPAAFIVDQRQKIAFLGRPDDEQFATVLAAVMTGRYDPVLMGQADPALRSARRARKVKNWRMAMRHYDEVIALDSRVFAEVALERFRMMIVDMSDRQGAFSYARDDLIGRAFSGDPGALRMLAVLICTDAELEATPDELEVARTAADRALEIEGGDDPESLATSALVNYHLGNFDEAVRLQTRAYFLARPARKADHKRVLSSYRQAAHRAETETQPN